MYRTAHEWVRLGHLVVVGTVAFSVVALVTPIEEPDPDQLVLFAVSAVGIRDRRTCGHSSAVTASDGYTQSTVIVGAGDVGQLVAQKAAAPPGVRHRAGRVRRHAAQAGRADVASVPIVGVIDDLVSIVRKLAVDRVIVAFSRQNDQDTLARVRLLAGLNVHVDVVPRHVRDDRSGRQADGCRGDAARQHLALRASGRLRRE